MAEDRTSREDAKRVCLTGHRIMNKMTNIYRKLGVRNRFEASQWALARGIVRGVAAPTTMARVAKSSMLNSRQGGGAVPATP